MATLSMSVGTSRSVGGTFMVLMTVVTIMNVFARYFFNAPMEWAEEFGRYTFIWLVFTGAVVATKAKEAHHHRYCRCTFVPAAARRVMAVLADIATMVVMLMLLYYGWRLMAFTTQPTATLKIPQYWIYLECPFSAALIILHSVATCGTTSWRCGIEVTSHDARIFALMVVYLPWAPRSPFPWPLAAAMYMHFVIGVPLEGLAQRMVGGLDTFPLLAIPFFILAGNLMNTGGITVRLVTFARVLVGTSPAVSPTSWW